MRIKKRKGLLGCAVILVLMTCSSCGNLEGKHERIPVLLADRKMEFATEKVISKDIQSKIEVQGRVISDKFEKLSFKKSGRLASYDVYVGKEVKKGDVLATLDITNLERKLKIAKMRLEQEKNKVEIIREKGDLREIKNAEIELKIKEMELSELEEYFDSASLVAGIDGIIASFALKDVGASVTRNVTMITILQESDLRALFKLDKGESENIKIGDPVQLIIDNKKYECKVEDMSERIAIVKIPKDIENRFKVSNKIVMKKELDTIAGALLIPRTAVYTDTKGECTVQVLNDGKIITRSIKIGIEVDEYYQILEGVKEGEEIIIK